jgi:hypothetical protein
MEFEIKGQNIGRKAKGKPIAFEKCKKMVSLEFSKTMKVVAESHLTASPDCGYSSFSRFGIF